MEQKSIPSAPKVEDVTAKVVGDFGRWQFCICFFMSLLKLPNAWYQLNIIFMAPPQDFWCEKPKSFAMYSDEEWRKICSPWILEHPCLIFDPILLKANVKRRLIPLIPCPKFVYDTSVFSRTITSDWDLVCSKHWLAHITQFVMMSGVLVGSLIFGVLADKYGRKIPLMVAIIVQAVASFIVSVIPWFGSFLFVWFILAMGSGGLSLITFVMTMEVVSGKWRTIILIIYYLPFGLGNTVMSGLAYWLRDWRKLEFALATLSSLFILYWFWIPESPRWLIASGRINEAFEILNEAAIKNKREFNPNEVKGLLSKNIPKKIAVPGFKAFLKSKQMRIIIVLLSANWLCMGIAFYTFSQYLGLIGDNIFLTVAITGIISVPGALVCVGVVNRLKRRMTLWIFQFFTGICFVLLLIIPKDRFDSEWPILIVAGSGYAGMAGSVPTLFLYSGELFPTLGRNVGVGGVTLFAKIGSMVAPAVVGLNDVVPSLPLVLLAAMCFAQILLLVPLPETTGCPLPDTLEEAENLAQSRKLVQTSSAVKREELFNLTE